MLHCTLCNSTKTRSFQPENDPRFYYLCADCNLIFTDPKFYLIPEESKKRYQSHNNSIENKGYVDFLNKAIKPALPFLNKHMQGLDYGCGPGPTLSLILEKEGISCDNYDPVFFNTLEKDKYDFIFSTETFEHFFNPAKDLQKIDNLLSEEGFLIIMTNQWKTLESFQNWYYKRDPTHVSFYHSTTFNKISSLFNYELIYNDNDRVVILKKSKKLPLE